MAGGTKGLSALGTFLEAGGADNRQLVSADKISAPRVEAGFAGQGVQFSEKGIRRQGERPRRKAPFNIPALKKNFYNAYGNDNPDYIG